MDAVKVLINAALVATGCIHSSVATAQDGGPFDPETQARIEVLQPFVTEAARRFLVPEAWIRAVLAAESGGRTELKGKPITSSAGAMGPMQVMPETYKEMQRRFGLGSNPTDPENNILAGTAYLSELYRRFGTTGMFAAYNAGPERYQQFLDTGRPLPAETVAYLAALQISAPVTPTVPSSASGQSLFFQLQDQAPTPSATHPDTSGGDLFIPLAPPASDPGAEKKAH